MIMKRQNNRKVKRGLEKFQMFSRRRAAGYLPIASVLVTFQTQAFLLSTGRAAAALDERSDDGGQAAFEFTFPAFSLFGLGEWE